MFGKEKSQYIEDSKFRYTMREMKKNGSAYILALPYFLLFLIFTGIPVVISLPVGFTNFNMVQFPQWVGLSNFYTLFLQDDVFLIAIQNTLVFAIITGPVSYIACFLLAWLINEMPGPLKTVFTYIFYAPTLAGNIYATWQLIFSGDTYGFLNSVLISLGLINGPQQWLTDARYILMCVIIVQMWMSLGAGFLSLRAGFQGIDKYNDYTTLGRLRGWCYRGYQEPLPGTALYHDPRYGPAASVRGCNADHIFLHRWFSYFIYLSPIYFYLIITIKYR